MIKRFLIPFVASFVIQVLLSEILTMLAVGLFYSTGSIGILSLALILGIIIPYSLILVFGFSKYRKDKLRLLAIVAGPPVLGVIFLIFSQVRTSLLH